MTEIAKWNFFYTFFQDTQISQPDSMDDPTSLSEDPGKEFQSPFGSLKSNVSPSRRRPARSTSNGVLIVLGIGVAIFLGFLIHNWKNDPLRTLGDLPIEDYLQNYASLEGTRFRSQLRVTDQLGWKENFGRHVVFEIGSTGKPIVALVPPKYDNTQFPIGRKFVAELYIGQGGQVKINYLKEN